MDFNRFCDEVLSLIEYDETSLLNWGFIEVASDLDQHIDQLLGKLSIPWFSEWEFFQDDGKSFEDIIDNLLDRKLIFKTPEGLYRTRYAETIRLLVLLRQRFSDSDWATGAKLVGDARIQLQRRRYPKRDISYAQLVSSLEDLKLSSDVLSFLDILTKNSDGKEFLLAGFQQKAIHTQLRLLFKGRGEHGIVIGAGTGSGKTKAFYIPALTWLSQKINNNRYVSIIAIYPRNELLKDQFSEAVRETLRLNKILHQQGKRPISIGAYYGDTPQNNKDKSRLGYEEDWNVPHLKCPSCESNLLWVEKDKNNNISMLRCKDNGCGFTTDAQHILITRDQMEKTPPDILFTTTEMLNRRLSKAESTLFGIRATTPPQMLLLDEIHTYEDINGANIGYLLRRWRKACGYDGKRKFLCIVGLSATLAQPVEVLAKLTGLSRHHIYNIQPLEEELDDEGMEYNVVLKADPTGGAALLSTSIQTAMLMGRILDPLSRGNTTYAPKVFAFCNRLDTLNRWYDNQKDAESRKRLSKYRDWPDDMEANKRESIKRAGQDWSICKKIGNSLTDPLTIDRTSSQTKGVDSNAKLVIATSALEVGYNDAGVGAVIQHQTPQNTASFLQRKGRAGRDRNTRPWTIVITSAYGRDRWAFQHAEMLFSPILPPTHLPLENYYVRKIQAAYVLMDWLAYKLHKLLPHLNLWDLLANNQRNGQNSEHERNEVNALLEQLLDKPHIRQEYINYLREALCLTGQENDVIIRSLLWGEPRPIFMEVVPTLINRLKTNWRKYTKNTSGILPDTYPKGRVPMPEFVPPSLFSDLNIPELVLYLGDKEVNGQFIQTFEEILPGKVTKRYVTRVGMWLPLTDDALSKGSEERVDLNRIPMEYDPVPIPLHTDKINYTIQRPTVYHLKEIPYNLSETSTSYPIWRSSFRAKGLQFITPPSLRINLRNQSHWSQQIRGIDVYSQVIGSAVEVTRGLIGVQVTHSYTKGERIYKKVYFSVSDNDGQKHPAGIGYVLDVDGICISYNPVNMERVRQSTHWKNILISARPHIYRRRLEADPIIEQLSLTPFEVEWLWQITYSAIIALATGGKQTLTEAHNFLEQKFNATITRTMEILFQEQFEPDEPILQGRLEKRLEELLQNSDLKNALLKHISALWEPEPVDLDEWLDIQYASSLSATFFSAISSLIDDINVSDLRLDVEHDEKRFWITETTPGGIGVIAKVAEIIMQHPRQLELKLIDTIRHCDRERTWTELHAITKHLQHEKSGIASVFAEIRAKQDFVSLHHAKQKLSSTLSRLGIPATRPLVVAINTKFLRPRSNKYTDNLTIDLIKLWEEERIRLGCDIDLRVFAVAANRREPIPQQINAIVTEFNKSEFLNENQKFNLIQSMLWTECHDSCEDCIQYKSPYQTLPRASRYLLRALIETDIPVISYEDDDWSTQLMTALNHRYEVAIRCDHDSSMEQLKKDIIACLIKPIEVGMQLFYPTVERIERQDQHTFIHLILREMVGS